jgi:hypothetical protein
MGAGQTQTQRSSTDEEMRPRSSIEEEKGSNSSSSSMQSCHTHASSNSDDVKGQAGAPVPSKLMPSGKSLADACEHDFHPSPAILYSFWVHPCMFCKIA